MKAQQLWEMFVENNPHVAKETYEAWQFGGNPNQLLSLVKAGIKTATASAFLLYEIDNATLPSKDSYSVILNSKEEAEAIIKTTKVSVVPFCEVSKEHAYREGEGDRSLTYWREVHEAFFKEKLASVNVPFSEDMLVVCEEFVLCFWVETE